MCVCVCVCCSNTEERTIPSPRRYCCASSRTTTASRGPTKATDSRGPKLTLSNWPRKCSSFRPIRPWLRLVERRLSVIDIFIADFRRKTHWALTGRAQQGQLDRLCWPEVCPQILFSSWCSYAIHSKVCHVVRYSIMRRFELVVPFLFKVWCGVHASDLIL